MLRDGVAAVDLDDDDQRLRVIALGGDELARRALERGGRREVGVRRELAPLGRLGPQLGVDLRPQSRAGAAVEREEARADAERRDERDRERELRAQAAGEQSPSHAARSSR